MGEKEDTEDCSGGAPDDVESAPATPPATAPSGVAVTPEPVEALAEYVDPLNEAVKAVGSVLSRKFVDPFAEEIKKLKDERAELNKARRAAQRKLKNETRKRKRLVEKASALSATELVHVLHMRSERAASRASSASASAKKAARPQTTVPDSQPPKDG